MNTGGIDDPYALKRFTSAQERVYEEVLSEIRGGRKQTHWMWYIFPQISGLRHSDTAKHYAIKSVDEAREYMRHPVLGARLRECTEAVLAIEGRAASEIFGSPDDVKLRSSMTLFAVVSGTGSVFHRVLDKYFRGEQDSRTLQILGT